MTVANHIQTLMRDLLRVKGQPTSALWQLHVGAAFSLWRAVFICHAGDLDVNDNIEERADDYLTKLVETNAISFNDDRDMRAWAGGYYVNNALFRLGLRSVGPITEGTRRHGQQLSELWDEAFNELRRRVPEIHPPTS